MFKPYLLYYTSLEAAELTFSTLTVVLNAKHSDLLRIDRRRITRD
jgi:hypothetical protein